MSILHTGLPLHRTQTGIAGRDIIVVTPYRLQSTRRQGYASDHTAMIPSPRDEFEALLKTFVEIPSVSLDPAKKDSVHQMARTAKDTLQRFGAEAKIVPTDGYPLVVGRIVKDRRFPTVTIYNHLDVQPAEEPEWKQDPFRLSIRDDRYYGRGSTDDKGPALAALFAARLSNDVPINIQFLWELEEEIGSPHFQQGLERSKITLTDSVLVSDTIWVSRQRPAVSYGLRGLLGVLLRIQTGARETHSGLTGGAARNPIGELCAVIAALHNAKTGHIQIPKFYQDVVPPSRAEVRSMETAGFQTRQFMEAHRLKSLRARTTRDVIRRIWTEPTLEVHGIAGGYQGPGVKTVVPPWAEAKLSFRLVPHQNPHKIFQRVKTFVKQQNKDVEVILGASMAPYLGPFEGPYADAARRALRQATGRTPAFVREGGSIGAVLTMQKWFKAPVICIGLSLPEHGYHAPNEYFDWNQADCGMRTFISYFKQIAMISR